MSHYTKEWEVNDIREVISFLDEKTGLYGADYPIRLGKTGRENRLGYFRYGPPGEGMFCFNRDYMNSDWFREEDAIDLIRHEYAHYYVWATGIERWIPNERNRVHHGAPWKYACQMVGATGKSKYYSDYEQKPDISREEAIHRYLAIDVEECDILRHLEKWDCPYLKPEVKESMNRFLRGLAGPNMFFDAPCCAVHMEHGFGVVLETYPSKDGQKIYIVYETGKKEVTTADQLFKMVDGVIQTKRNDL
ncbi:MAG: hypothetical protein IJ486_05555 [Firmicutes bacterium]|nr:hypothetical protein [Bacillota bacterium]